MKRLLVLLITVPLFGQQIDHKTSWPLVTPGIATGYSSYSTVLKWSDDERGTIRLITSAQCCPSFSGDSRVVLVTYGQPYLVDPYPNIYPVNSNAAALSGDNAVFVHRESANRLGFEIGVRKGGLEPNKVYEWGYTVTR
jgi:hypothetical protein